MRSSFAETTPREIDANCLEFPRHKIRQDRNTNSAAQIDDSASAWRRGQKTIEPYLLAFASAGEAPPVAPLVSDRIVCGSDDALPLIHRPR